MKLFITKKRLISLINDCQPNYVVCDTCGVVYGGMDYLRKHQEETGHKQIEWMERVHAGIDAIFSQAATIPHKFHYLGEEDAGNTESKKTDC